MLLTALVASTGPAAPAIAVSSEYEPNSQSDLVNTLAHSHPTKPGWWIRYTFVCADLLSTLTAVAVVSEFEADEVTEKLIDPLQPPFHPYKI
jgi:hypothetical protein